MMEPVPFPRPGAAGADSRAPNCATGATAVRGDREPLLGRLPGLLVARRGGCRAPTGPVLHAGRRGSLGAARPAPLPAARPLCRRRRGERGRRPARLPDRGDRPRHGPALRARGGGGGLGQWPTRKRILGAARPHPRSRQHDPGRRRHRSCPLGPAPQPFAARNVATRVLLGFRDAAHSGGLDDLFVCCEVRLASEDGHIGHHGYVTDLLAAMLDGDDAWMAVVLSCGPPAMLEAVRAMCLDRDVPCQLAMESPMACGYGACYGCAVSRPTAAPSACASMGRWFSRWPHPRVARGVEGSRTTPPAAPSLSSRQDPRLPAPVPRASTSAASSYGTA